MSGLIEHLDIRSDGTETLKHAIAITQVFSPKGIAAWEQKDEVDGPKLYVYWHADGGGHPLPSIAKDLDEMVSLVHGWLMSATYPSVDMYDDTSYKKGWRMSLSEFSGYVAFVIQPWVIEYGK